MKWIVGVFSVTFALLAVGLFTSIGQSQQPAKEANSSRTLTASGTGTAKVEADMARITFRIEAVANDLKSAREALDKKAGKLKEALDALKLSADVRALPVEVQQNGAAFGGGFMGVPGGPPMNPGAPGGAAPANPPVPMLPAQPPQRPVDGFIAAQAPGAPNPPAVKPAQADPAVPPAQPVPPRGIGLPAPPNGFGGGFNAPMGFGGGFNGGGYQLSQSLVVTIKNAESAKLFDGVNKSILTGAENGVVIGNQNPFGPPGGMRFGVGGGGGFAGIGGGFQGIAPNQNGPHVTFHRVDDKEARRKALEAAVADAVANAKVMARGANVTITDTISINDPPASRTGQPFNDFTGGFQGDNTTGEMEIVVKVTVICSY
jgi:uncharacterized protein YggE